MSVKEWMWRLAIHLFALLHLLELAQGQYPAASIEWDFMPLTGSDNVAVTGGNVLTKGGTLGALNGKGTWLRPTITELGWMFEGYHIACGGPGATWNLGDTFGFHTWIYFTDITATQTLWCKEWLQTETNSTLTSLRLCLKLINGQFKVLWNPSNAATHLKDYLQTDAFNYYIQPLGMFAKYGWTYLAVNFRTSPVTNEATIWGYSANHDQCRTVSDSFTLPGPIVDDNKFIFCLGATAYPDRVARVYRLTDPLLALVNNVYFVKGEVIERWNAMDAFGFQCHEYCQICRYGDQPKCLEDFETHVLHYWDFAPFRWYRPVWDYGNKPATIPLGIVMTGQALYTNNNGMWFDGGRTLVPAPIRWAVYSFSVDVWFKFYSAVGGTMIESISGNPRTWRLWFTAPRTVSFSVNGQAISTLFTFNGATDYNKWMIVQASTARQSLTSSKLCVKVNADQIFCGTVARFYDDTTPTVNNQMRIGQGFGGYMRKIKIYDYPKMEPSMLMMYKTAPQCYKFHHTQASCSFCDVDYNFTCYTSCKERNMWDYDCKLCEGTCYTCSGNDKFHCFSCYETRYRFHERCTCCPETCGDSRFMGDSEYDCDDGNNNVDDGCNGNCLYEAGFACIAGTPTTRTVCTEICGDGRKINHRCDDANTGNGDGCSSTCNIEVGYQCTGGDRNTVDVCWEICGDGRDLGNYGCDDGNTVAGDGCNSVCAVEIGWRCTGGTLTTADTCTEICGDGFRTNAVCDDGNTAAGDGCSATCTVENGWQCGSEAPSICWKISQPSIVDYSIDGSLISVTFNETVILGTGYTADDFDLSISGPLTPYNLNWELLSSSVLMAPTPNLTIWFSYSSSSQFFGNGSETLTLTFTDKTRIKNSAYNFGMINSSLSFTLYPQESDEGCGELIFQIMIYFIMAAIIGVGIISTLVGHSMTIAWQALTIVQFVNFIPFMMIYSPSCMVKFSKGFDVFNGKIFSFIEWLSYYSIKRDDFFNEIDHKFIRAGYTSSAILYNGHDLLLIWLGVLLIIPVLYLIQRIFFNSNYAFRLHLDKFRNAVIYVLVLYTYLRLCFLSFLNLRYAKFEDWYSWTSTTIAIITSILVAGYPLYEAWNVKQFYIELTTGRMPTYFRLYILYSEFKVSHPLQYAYYWQYFLRRFLFIAMVIGWPQQPYLTLCLSTLMHISAMLYVTFVLPFQSRMQNIGVMIAEGGMVVIHGTLFALLRDDASTGKAHYSQSAMLFFLSVLVTVCILAVLIVIDSLAHIKKVCRMCKRERGDDGIRKILDSISSDSLTEREVSLEDEDEKNNVKYELYDPQKDKTKFQLEKGKKLKKGKGKGKDKKKARPKTPPTAGEALVSQFGRPLFRETQDVGPGPDDTDSDGGDDNQSINDNSRADDKRLGFTPI